MSKQSDVRELLDTIDTVEIGDMIRDKNLRQINGTVIGVQKVGKGTVWQVEIWGSGKKTFVDRDSAVLVMKNEDWTEEAKKVYNSLTNEDFESGEFDEFIQLYHEKGNSNIVD
jgi:hypothetical protein